MAVNIAKSISKKNKGTNKKTEAKKPTPGTIVKGEMVEPETIVQGKKKPTTKIDTSAIAQPSELKKKLKPFIEKLNDKQKVAASSKKAADKDAKAVKDLKEEIIKLANDNNLADEATIDVTDDGKILKVGVGKTTSKLTDPLKAYNLLEEIEEGLGDKLMTFSLTDLGKHLSSKQLESVTAKATNNKQRAVTLKDE